MILITTFTLCLSLLAVSVAIGAWLVTRRGSVASLSQRFALLSTRLESIEQLSEKLSRELRNDRAARNMAAGRARVQNSELAELSNGNPQPNEEEKVRIRRELSAQLARGMSPLKPAG